MPPFSWKGAQAYQCRHISAGISARRASEWVPGVRFSGSRRPKIGVGFFRPPGLQPGLENRLGFQPEGRGLAAADLGAAEADGDVVDLLLLVLDFAGL